RCAHWERFLAHTAGPFPPTLPTAATIAIRTPPLPPSPGETLRPRGFSHRRRDAKSLIYWTKRLRRGMGGAGWVVAQDGRDLTVERVGCDTLGFPAVVAGDLWPPRTKGYHDVRTEKPSDPGHAARRAG